MDEALLLVSRGLAFLCVSFRPECEIQRTVGWRENSFHVSSNGYYSVMLEHMSQDSLTLLVDLRRSHVLVVANEEAPYLFLRGNFLSD